MERVAWVLVPPRGEAMHSRTPAALHTICGKTLLKHTIDALQEAGLTPTLIADEEAGAMPEGLPCAMMQKSSANQNGDEALIEWTRQLGTHSGCVVFARADMPLVTEQSLRALIHAVETENCAAAVLGEAADGVYCMDMDALRWTLTRLCAGEAMERFPAEAVRVLASAGYTVRTLAQREKDECLRVTNRATLAKATEHMRSRINEKLMENGVTLIDPQRVYADCDVNVGCDTVIYPGCILENGTVIGAGCTLYANCRLNHAKIGDGVTIESSVILDASVADHTTVGPYAYIRPNTSVGEGCRIGDFVELKNSHIGNGTKVSHLTYVGDSDLGEKINLGCGVVFVNYDGKKKQRSTVGDHAFIGCNVNLVAPVHVGRDAYIAAGSTVTCDVPEGALLVAREREAIKEGWVAARKESGKL